MTALAPRLDHGLLLAICVASLAAPACSQGPASADPQHFAEVFDTHWERLRDDYPYFELYGVDWEAERAEHRPRAVAADNGDEFTWELARMISALPDPHVAFLPSPDLMRGRWSAPDVEVRFVERRALVVDWPEGQGPEVPAAFAGREHVYPEIVEVQGSAAIGGAHILAAGPLDTRFDVRLRWPDGSERTHTLTRPPEANLPPERTHYGERWLVHGRVGPFGYMRVRTFDPERATAGPDGKLTTALRAALADLADCEGLVLDFQGNGGGLVAASDPFLGNLLKRTRSYRWGNADGKRRVIRTRRPRYDFPVTCVVDEGTASGGEWAARILRDAGRATVIGGRTQGAEAAVHTSEGPDGSLVHFSAWPLAEPGVTPFQEVGIQRDVELPLTVAAVRASGYEAALEAVRHARWRAALSQLGAEEAELESLVQEVAGLWRASELDG